MADWKNRVFVYGMQESWSRQKVYSVAVPPTALLCRGGVWGRGEKYVGVKKGYKYSFVGLESLGREKKKKIL